MPCLQSVTWTFACLLYWTNLARVQSSIIDACHRSANDEFGTKEAESLNQPFLHSGTISFPNPITCDQALKSGGLTPADVRHILPTNQAGADKSRNCSNGFMYRGNCASADDHDLIWETSGNAHNDGRETMLGFMKRGHADGFHLVKRSGGNRRKGLAHFSTKGLAKCKVTDYCFKPEYPGPTEVLDSESGPVPQMLPFHREAKYWAVASRSSDDLLTVPSWSLTLTTQQAGMPDGEEPGFAIGGSGKYYVTIDHVYELKLLDMFFLEQIIDNKIDCNDIKVIFDIPGADGTRLNVLFSNLATYQNPEFVGMDNRINQAKALIWQRFGTNSNSAPIQFQSGGHLAPEFNMKNLAMFAIALQLVNDYRVRALFERTNARIYQAFANFGPDLAAAYKEWMTNKVRTQNDGLQAAAQRVIAAIPTDVSDPRAYGFEDKVPRWSSYMSSLLVTYPLAAMTLPAVHGWPVLGTQAVAVPTALEGNSSVPSVTSGFVAPAVTSDSRARIPNQLGNFIRPTATPGITSTPTTS